MIYLFVIQYVLDKVLSDIFVIPHDSRQRSYANFIGHWEFDNIVVKLLFKIVRLCEKKID